MIRTTGVKEIDAVLKGLNDQLSDKVIQAANIYASKPLVEKAKLLAPEGPTGHLVDSIGAVKDAAKLDSRAIGQVQVGPRRRGGYKGFAGHLVGYGTKERQTKKGANRGKMIPNNFMEKAFNATKEEILNRFNDTTGRSLANFMKRTVKNS